MDGSEGHNIHLDYRVAPAAAQVQTLAKELVALQPDVIFVESRPATAALQKETHTIPIVFTYVIDPIGAGFIASLARPGGNITGIMAYEEGIVGKWMGMLKEIAPQTARISLLGNPKTAVYYDYLLHAAEAAAPSLGIEIVPSRIENDAADIERAIVAFASMPNGAMVVLPDFTTTVNDDLIITLAARNRLPAVYNFKFSSVWAVSCLTGLSTLTTIGRQRITSIKSSAVPSRPTYRYRRRRSTRPPSISKQPKLSV